MAEASCQLSFIVQIQNARDQINTNFPRLIQNVSNLQARLLKELETLEAESRKQKENEDELRRLTQKLNQDFSSSLSAITRRIEQLVIEKGDGLLMLDWNFGAEQTLLNQFCRISVKKLTTEFSEEKDFVSSTLPTNDTIQDVYSHSCCYYSESDPEVEETYDDDVDNSDGTSSSEEVLEKQTLEEKYKQLDTPTCNSVSKGCGRGDLDDPRGVSIDDTTDEIYVADYNNHCVVVFERDGEYLREFTHNRLVGPIGICVSGSMDRVYLTLGTREAVHCYKRDGTFLKEILNYSPANISFDSPSGIALGTTYAGSERVYVCDSGNNRVPVFSKFLVYLTTLTIQLNAPRDVLAVGSEVAVLHEGTYLVSFFSRGGMFLRRVVKQGHNKQKVGTPCFFCIDSDANILITDTHHDCVKIYRNSGFHICNVGSRGDSPGEFREPSGIALFDGQLSHSIVTLCDRDEDQLQIFSL